MSDIINMVREMIKSKKENEAAVPLKHSLSHLD